MPHSPLLSSHTPRHVFRNSFCNFLPFSVPRKKFSKRKLNQIYTIDDNQINANSHVQIRSSTHILNAQLLPHSIINIVVGDASFPRLRNFIIVEAELKKTQSDHGVHNGEGVGVHSQVLAQIFLQRSIQVAGSDRPALQFRWVSLLASLWFWLGLIEIGYLVIKSSPDLNGDALHSSIGLPPALNVATAKVGKLEIMVSG